MKRAAGAMLMLMLMLNQSASAQVRLKDIGRLAGAGGVRVTGYGLVVGLDRSGDSQKSLFTNQSLVNMLERFGIAVESDKVRSQNVAAVMVTADIPPFSRAGNRFDVTVSSIGDAKSLQGGVLLQANLSDEQSEFWGFASGPVSLGGFNIETGLVSIRRNHPNVARIPNGGSLLRDTAVGTADSTHMTFVLRNGDFTTANRAAEAINSHCTAPIAKAVDAATIEVAVPDTFLAAGNGVGFAAALESVTIAPDASAKVVINERTGTIVVGEKVSLSTVNISHGSLTITIKGALEVSQPPPFSAGTTAVVPYQEISVEQQGTGVVTVPGAATVGDIAAALNRLGVTPRDIIAIFQALKESGALQADLVII
jgi:flagellar P-ring protein precursor FlgI